MISLPDSLFERGRLKRGVLPLFGFVLGTAGVVMMMAFGLGAGPLGTHSDLLVLKSGAVKVAGVVQEAGAVTRLSLDDMAAIQEQVLEVQQIAPNVSGRMQVAYLNRNWNTEIVGSTASYQEVSAPAAYGRFFSEEEERTRARVAVIGSTVMRELFPDRDPIGETIKINRVNFEVIGVLASRGANSWQDQDDVVMVPLETAMHRVLGKDFIDAMDIKLRDGAKTSRAQSKILNVLYAKKRVAVSQRDSAFQLRRMDEMQASAGGAPRLTTALYLALMVLTILMGGTGIMNAMWIELRERPGGSASHFALESAALGLAGGAAGTVLGLAICATLKMTLGIGWSFGLVSALAALFGVIPFYSRRLHAQWRF
jgi:macrolide transport system ATP-binding/permease protein